MKRWTVLPGGDFALMEEDVLAVEAALPQELAAIGPSLLPSWGARTAFWEHLDRYRRQYTGMIRAGERYVAGNIVLATFCEGRAWETEFVGIEDGGWGVISILVQLPSRLFVDISTNGYA